MITGAFVTVTVRPTVDAGRIAGTGAPAVLAVTTGSTAIVATLPWARRLGAVVAEA